MRNRSRMRTVARQASAAGPARRRGEQRRGCAARAAEADRRGDRRRDRRRDLSIGGAGAPHRGRANNTTRFLVLGVRRGAVRPRRDIARECRHPIRPGAVHAAARAVGAHGVSMTPLRIASGAHGLWNTCSSSLVGHREILGRGRVASSRRKRFPEAARQLPCGLS